MAVTSSFVVIVLVSALWLFRAIDGFNPTAIASLFVRNSNSNSNSNRNLKSATNDDTATTRTFSTTIITPPKLPKTAIIVGCGPAGLATALILARNHKYDKVTIIESNSQERIASYERSKAYFYNINERGQTLTKLFPTLQRSIEENGVGITKFERIDVPGDPKELFTGVPFSRQQTEEDRKKFGKFYWIPRHTLVQCMLDEVKNDKNIEIIFNTRCGDIHPLLEDENGNSNGKGRGFQVEIASETGDGLPLSTIVINANLVVGADGLGSTVREQLYNNPERFTKLSNYDRNNFLLRKYHSPSSGLRIKTLQIEPNFNIPVGGGDNKNATKSASSSERAASYSIQSVNRGLTDQIGISLLPLRDYSAVRPAAICTLPNHDLWKIHTGEEMKAWFQKAFPRFDFDGVDEGENGRCPLVAEGEWDQFAKSEGTVFPLCQYSPGAVAYDDSREAGIILVGDALHAFPPDLGQGVNAAFRDVAVLDKCLHNESSDNDNKKGTAQPSTSTSHPQLGQALNRFQKRHGGPETKALIKLARFGAPFQYGQSSRIMTIGRYLWTMNIALRLLLNKLLGTPKPAVIQMADSSLSFQTIMRRCDRLTVALWSVIAVMVGLLLKCLRMRLVVG